MSSIGSFRDWIEFNKRKVVEYLSDGEWKYTWTIASNYLGEKDMYQVRKALNELHKEGKIEKRKQGLNSNQFRLTIKEDKE